ncbi:Protein of unknown function (DUF2911) [Flavobacterium araucananum]|jgi:hypothetical protein|uniref:Asparagine synthetase B n=1 Tax=Flavobacterium araucananum TaxID=946678 RepID=A0A227PIU0_9FLAO|nr:DUF2911 domain-containing protein [Flavobacterium araucananum]OXG08965.1 hypothetical protein B0A64_02925 [Flavobacterium araucananum]PWJ99857.1 Protein of unknown function (DUF2911) [Flavobacterium araucananum]
MKKLSLMAVTLFAAFTVQAQDAVKFAPLDASPVDISYFPSKSVKFKKTDNPSPAIKVIYSRPAVKGRTIFGDLIKFGEVWRVGANENTEIKFYKPVTIDGKNIPAGTYSLFAIPEKDKWTIIINKEVDMWGAYAYDETKDVARVSVPVKPISNVVEALSIAFTTQGSVANLVIGWDKTTVEVPITIK